MTELKNNTHFALIYIRVDGRQLTIDARPSAAISLALRTKNPIHVAKKVLEASSVLHPTRRRRRSSDRSSPRLNAPQAPAK